MDAGTAAVIGAGIGAAAGLAGTTVTLATQWRRDKWAYQRRVRDERRNRLLGEFATLDSVAFDFFRMASAEQSVLKELQASATRRSWWIVRLLRGPLSRKRAEAFKAQEELLTGPIRERFAELKRSVSLVKLDSDTGKLETWDQLIAALDDYNQRFLRIMPTWRGVPAAVNDMEKSLRRVLELYDELSAALRRELEVLENESPAPISPRQRRFGTYPSLAGAFRSARATQKRITEFTLKHR